MEIKIITEPMSRKELLKIASEQFGDMIKTVVDVTQEIMAVGGELHADGEAVLTEKRGSKGYDLWGINLYPEKSGEEWIEFDSMINLKPARGNRSRDVEDAATKAKIVAIVRKLVPR